MTENDPVTAGDGAEPGRVRRWLSRRARNTGEDACDACDGCDGCDLFFVAFVHAPLFGRSPEVAVPDVMRTDPALSRATRLVLAVLRWYKRAVSARTRSVCRFTPSCSAYAAEAVRRHGPTRGGVLTVRRLRRCRPHGERGHDPVPLA